MADKIHLNNNTPLLRKLSEYSAADYYPFHMPGHKRQVDLGITSFPNPFSVDITEIDGFDNLHYAEGILKKSMERAAAIYGADRTFYLINGSTSGILSAICGLTEPGDRILMARNSHKSAYHALVLNQLEPVFIYPQKVDGYPIQGGISAVEIEKALLDNRQKGDKPIRAVFITSPTYEGIVSDVQEIARLSHQYGIPLIVDEAHGAHFGFAEGFPKSAVQCGADIVIQSLHKTLPALTQTALLHLKGDLVASEQMERYLSIFQSSSPSYVLLASIENCITYMDREGKLRLLAYSLELKKWMERAQQLKYIKILDDTVCNEREIKARDLSKIVLFPKDCSLNGTQLAERLREEYHLEPEMTCGNYVLLMTSMMDTREGMDRLWQALTGIDQEIAQKSHGCELWLPDPVTPTWTNVLDRAMIPSKAWQSRKSYCELQAASGEISGSFITVYPPGVPMLIPGEVITEEAVRLILENLKLGLSVEGLSERNKILVCRIEESGEERR